MGTRHLICVFKDNEYKVAQYGQWDGYPGGQGVRILKFLREEMVRPAFDSGVAKLRWLAEREIEELNREQVNLADYPELSRDTSAELLPLILQSSEQNNRPIKLINHIEFAKDSLFCEWAYVIDLDKNTLEVYKGFNKQPLDSKERFYSEKEPNVSHREDQYYPVALVKKYELDALPTEEAFLSEFQEDE
jgi:hypothetical protein